jgi:cell division protein FtsL
MVARTQPLVLPVPQGREFHVVIGPRGGRHRIGGWVALAITVAASFFLLIFSRIALDRSAFVLEDVQREIATQEARYWDLRLQVTELQSPDRIAGMAADMGMVYPAELHTVTVPGLGDPNPGVEERWADLKALLGAQP